MSRIAFLSIALVSLVFFSGMVLFTKTPPPDETDLSHAILAQRKYMGVGKCKTCHKKPEDGEQYRIWLEGPHAKAYETLASDKAKAYAAERGIGNPQISDECLQCHVTAHGVDEQFLGPKYKITDGVGCESCHGAGGDYYKKKPMIAVTKGELDPASIGLTLPDEQVCLTCHNDKSPDFDGFNFEEAREKIAHPIPEAKMAEYN